MKFYIETPDLSRVCFKGRPSSIDELLGSVLLEGRDFISSECLEKMTENDSQFLGLSTSDLILAVPVDFYTDVKDHDWMIVMKPDKDNETMIEINTSTDDDAILLKLKRG